MELQENEYQIGGISINEIAQKYETPLYVYDAEQMQLQYSKLHNAFSKKCTVEELWVKNYAKIAKMVKNPFVAPFFAHNS